MGRFNCGNGARRKNGGLPERSWQRISISERDCRGAGRYRRGSGLGGWKAKSKTVGSDIQLRNATRKPDRSVLDDQRGRFERATPICRAANVACGEGEYRPDGIG